jgi:hypothetical protein
MVQLWIEAEVVPKRGFVRGVLDFLWTVEDFLGLVAT